jgi:hypothetical protein
MLFLNHFSVPFAEISLGNFLESFFLKLFVVVGNFYDLKAFEKVLMNFSYVECNLILRIKLCS